MMKDIKIDYIQILFRQKMLNVMLCIKIST